MNRSVCHIFRPEEFPERSACSPKGNLVVLDAIFFQYILYFFMRSISVNSLNRAFVHVCNDGIPVVVMNEFCKINLSHHGWHDMRVLQVEVILRTIQVCRHHCNVVGAILQVVRFAHLQTCYLCYSIFLISIFQRACQQTVFRHWLWSILWVYTGAAQEKQFLHTMSIGFTDDITLYLHVHHDEVCPVKTVRHYATHEGCCQYYCVWLLLVKESFYCYLICQVQFLVRTTYEIVISTSL